MTEYVEATGKCDFTFWLSEESILCHLPEELADRFQALPLERREELLENTLYVAMNKRGGDEAAHEQFYFYFSDGLEEDLEEWMNE